MRLSISLIALVGTAAVTLASPISSASLEQRHADRPVGVKVATIGSCPEDCWNEAAVVANCDPNVDDKCLCGPFFDAVTDCTSQTCSIGDNLAALSFLTPACQ